MARGRVSYPLPSFASSWSVNGFVRVGLLPGVGMLGGTVAMASRVLP